MKTISLKKVITLLSSLSFVILFLLYRGGAFDKSFLNKQPTLQSSHNGGNIKTSSIDTVKPVNDSVNSLMFSSSKVLILTDRNPTILDGLKKKSGKQTNQKKQAELLSSSKSFVVFTPQERFGIYLNSTPFSIYLDSSILKFDSSKTKKKKE